MIDSPDIKEPGPAEPAYTINNRLLVEPYKKEALQTTIKGGIAMVAQKVRLKGLKVLRNAKLADGTIIRAGATVFIREEILHNATGKAGSWAKDTYECEGVEGQFIIVEIHNIDMVVP